MPNQQKQILEYYQKNPSAALGLRGSIYEEKVINLIKDKSKKIKKTITIKEAEALMKENYEPKKTSKDLSENKETKKPKKTAKSTQNKKKIRKK